MTLLTNFVDNHVSSLRKDLLSIFVIRLIEKQNNSLSRMIVRQLLEMMFMMMTTTMCEHVSVLFHAQFRFITDDFSLFSFFFSFQKKSFDEQKKKKKRYEFDSDETQSSYL
jgi:hypothetical protein